MAKCEILRHSNCWHSRLKLNVYNEHKTKYKKKKWKKNVLYQHNKICFRWHVKTREKNRQNNQDTNVKRAKLLSWPINTKVSISQFKVCGVSETKSIAYSYCFFVSFIFAKSPCYFILFYFIYLFLNEVGLHANLSL